MTHLPPEVIHIILLHTKDAKARHSVLLSCKDYYDVALPHIYANVVLSTPKQVRSFAQTAILARSDATLAKHFRHTRRFTYRTGGISSGAKRYTNDPTLDQRLYLSLRDINSSIAGSTPPFASLFPNLEHATFEPLPPLPAEVRYVLLNQGATEDEDDAAHSPFLGSVKTVNLQHYPTGNYDKAPDFHLLGMQNVEQLTIHHLFGAEISSTVDIEDYLGAQPSLRHVEFHLEEHIAWAMGSNAANVVDSHSLTAARQPGQHTAPPHGQQANPFATTIHAGGPRSLDVDWYIYEYTAALSYTIFKLAYWALTHAPSNFPNLETIIVILGEQGDSIIDEIAERTREKVAEYKREYVDALQVDPPHSTQEPPLDNASMGFNVAAKPTKVVVKQTGGNAFVLDGRPLPPSEWGSHNRLWHEAE